MQAHHHQSADDGFRVYARATPRLRALVRDLAVQLVILLCVVVPPTVLANQDVLRVLAPVSLLAFVLYEPLLIALRGATLGHSSLNLRIVRARDFGRVSFPRALLRTVVKWIFGLPSFLAMYFTSKHQAIHDLAAGTVVIPREARRVNPDWFDPARPEPAATVLPGRMRRASVIFGHWLVWYLMFQFAIFLIVPADCIDHLRTCRQFVKLVTIATTLIWFAGMIVLAFAGWTGALWGAQRTPATSVGAQTVLLGVLTLLTWSTTPIGAQASATASQTAPPTSSPAAAQSTPQSVLGATPAPQRVPTPGPATDQPYAPQAILPGGIVVPIYPAGSPRLKAERVKEAEVYTMTNGVPGRIASIINIHNPSVELHRVPAAMNTGAVVIVVAGGGHNTLNVGSEAADFVPFFYNYGINTVILRNRLRRDGYDPVKDAVIDLLQAIKVVRAYAADWGLDPKKIGTMGFSAGAELTSHAAVEYGAFDAAEDVAGNPLAKISARPDFVGVIYPGPTPFRGGAPVAVPDDAPASFIASGGVGDANHAMWADEYFAAFLRARIPNLEMHIYGNGRHPGDKLPDGTTQTGGLTDRNDIPLGTWQFRFVDWFRDLGFLQKPGIETKAARDVATRVANPPKPAAPR